MGTTTSAHVQNRDKESKRHQRNQTTVADDSVLSDGIILLYRRFARNSGDHTFTPPAHPVTLVRAIAGKVTPLETLEACQLPGDIPGILA